MVISRCLYTDLHYKKKKTVFIKIVFSDWVHRIPTQMLFTSINGRLTNVCVYPSNALATAAANRRLVHSALTLVSGG
jgi:hypothetical protein